LLRSHREPQSRQRDPEQYDQPADPVLVLVRCVI